jgi:hypothetical protein
MIAKPIATKTEPLFLNAPIPAIDVLLHALVAALGWQDHAFPKGPQGGWDASVSSIWGDVITADKIKIEYPPASETRAGCLQQAGGLRTTSSPSPVSRIRSSPDFAARSVANFGFKGTRALNSLLVWLWFRSPHIELAAKSCGLLNRHTSVK